MAASGRPVIPTVKANISDDGTLSLRTSWRLRAQRWPESVSGMDWTSAAAASAARHQLANLLDTRQLAAAAAEQDALFAAWQGLALVAFQDLTLRAQQLRQLITYARPRPPAVLALAIGRVMTRRGRAS